jgi:hypothetical protein
MVIRSAAELKWIKKLLSNPKAAELEDSMNKINPQKKEHYSTTSTDIFEV